MRGFDATHLAGDCLKVAEIVREVLGPKADDGGCKPFYSPEEWVAKGERFGTKSVLVLVHDGGDLAPYCNYDYMEYEKVGRLSDALEKSGFYVENCTSWYSAVYKVC